MAASIACQASSFPCLVMEEKRIKVSAGSNSSAFLITLSCLFHFPRGILSAFRGHHDYWDLIIFQKKLIHLNIFLRKAHGADPLERRLPAAAVSLQDTSRSSSPTLPAPFLKLLHSHILAHPQNARCFQSSKIQCLGLTRFRRRSR